MKKNLDRDIGHCISTGRLMDVLGISRSAVCRLMASGMPHIKVGSMQRFPIEQVFRWLKENYGEYRGSSGG